MLIRCVKRNANAFGLDSLEMSNIQLGYKFTGIDRVSVLLMLRCTLITKMQFIINLQLLSDFVLFFTWNSPEFWL